MTSSLLSSYLKRYLRPLASLQLAVIVLALLAIVLAVATIYESRYGTQAVQRDIYLAGWFSLILVVLGINVAAATISRWPWKPKHVGFVITHAAILVILGGCLTTHWRGIRGKVLIPEAQQESRLLLDDWVLTAWQEESATYPAAVIPISQPPRLNQARRFSIDGQPYQLRIAQYLPDATAQTQVVEGARQDPAAVLVEMDAAGQKMEQWLFVDDATPQWSVRAPSFTLAAVSRHEPKVPTALPARGMILARIDGNQYQVDVEQAMRQPVPIGDGSTTVSVTQYFEHAEVSQDGLHENPDKQVNPAVVLELVTAQSREPRIVFARFGDISGMHPGSQPSPVKLAYQHPGTLASDVYLQIVPESTGLVLYEDSGTGPVQQATLEPDRPVSLKGMSLSLALKRYLPHARATLVVAPATRPSIDPRPAIDVELTGPQLQHRGWLAWGQPTTLPSGPQPLRMMFQPRQLELPFAVRLNRFDLEYYPGTRMPKTFRSNVTLLDEPRGEELTANIEVNRPLEYHGWMFFQDTYDQQAGRWVTGLAVSNDPGRPIVYGGSALLVLGTLTLAIQRLIGLARAGRAAPPGSAPAAGAVQEPKTVSFVETDHA